MSLVLALFGVLSALALCLSFSVVGPRLFVCFVVDISTLSLHLAATYGSLFRENLFSPVLIGSLFFPRQKSFLPSRFLLRVFSVLRPLCYSRFCNPLPFFSPYFSF